MLDTFPLCSDCIECIGGAAGGPDAPYHLASKGEPCEAEDCVNAEPDEDPISVHARVVVNENLDNLTGDLRERLDDLLRERDADDPDQEEMRRLSFQCRQLFARVGDTIRPHLVS